MIFIHDGIMADYTGWYSTTEDDNRPMIFCFPYMNISSLFKSQIHFEKIFLDLKYCVYHWHTVSWKIKKIITMPHSILLQASAIIIRIFSIWHDIWHLANSHESNFSQFGRSSYSAVFNQILTIVVDHAICCWPNLFWPIVQETQKIVF
jgi:hypothetical protein